MGEALVGNDAINQADQKNCYAVAFLSMKMPWKDLYDFLT